MAGRRARALLVAACEDQYDDLLAVKAAHADDPTEESRATKKAAMESYAHTRSWLRAVAAIEKAKTDGDDARLAEFQRDYGPLIAEMQALSPSAGGGPAELPPGSAQATPKPIHGRARSTGGA